MSTVVTRDRCSQKCPTDRCPGQCAVPDAPAQPVSLRLHVRRIQHEVPDWLREAMLTAIAGAPAGTLPAVRVGGVVVMLASDVRVEP